MSGVAKGVGKVFKKAAKVVKKVAPIALGAAAVYFTAGAALGFAPTLGAAAGSLTGSLGLSGTLGSVVTGAITQAGYGAAIGGLTAAATGGSISKGMQAGALTGAVTGGVTGGLGMNTDPLSSLNGGETASAAQAAAGGPGQLTAPGALSAPQVTTSLPGAVAPVSAPQSTGLMSWLNNNQTLVGTAVAGLGQGLMGAAEGSANREAQRDEREAITNNYALPQSTGLLSGMQQSGGSTGTGTAAPAQPRGLLSAQDRFSPDFYASQSGPTPTIPRTASGVGRYDINPATGRWEYIPASRVI